MWDEAEKEGKTKLLARGVQVVTASPEMLAKMKALFAPQNDEAIAAVDKSGKPGRQFFADYTK